MNDANFSDAEKQIGIFLSLMLTGTKTLLEIKRGKHKAKRCIQHVCKLWISVPHTNFLWLTQYKFLEVDLYAVILQVF